MGGDVVFGIFDRNPVRINRGQFLLLFLGPVFQIVFYGICTAQISVHAKGDSIQHLLCIESVKKSLQQPELIPGIPRFFFSYPLQELGCPILQLFIQAVLKLIKGGSSVS